MRSMLLAHAACMAANALNENINIYETDENYIIDIEVPHFNREDIKINRTHKGIHITGETTLDVPETYKGNKTRKIERHINLRRSIKSDTISAKLSNGVLRILISKQPVTIEEIEINVD